MSQDERLSASDEATDPQSGRPASKTGPSIASGNRSGESSAISSRPSKSWVRLSGAGLELAFITIVFGAIGAAIDHRLQLSRPLCSALGGLIGFVLGMVRFIRLAISISDQQRALESEAVAAHQRGAAQERSGSDRRSRQENDE